MVSKRSMALDTNTGKPKSGSDLVKIKSPKRHRKQRHGERRKGPRRAGVFSRLVRLIFLSHLVGLLVLVIGAVATSRFSQSLIDAKVDDLSVQTAMLTTLLGDSASGAGSLSELDRAAATQLLRRVDLPKQWRIRLFDKSGSKIADSAVLDDTITVTELAPILPEPLPDPWHVSMRQDIKDTVSKSIAALPWRVRERERLRRDINGDVRKAFLGETASGARYDENDKLIVSVTMPVRRVQQVLGAITLESTDVERIVQAERVALAPILGLAFLASLLSSLALTLFIARPIRRLARAAEYVTRSSRKRNAIPDLSKRRDEIGDLSVVIRDMTNGLYERIDDIANFAADVAHEIKNPLTSLRSASDTLRITKTEEQKEKLIDIIQRDVARMDRLISDISKASKVDANLARETAETLDVRLILSALEEFYQQTTEVGRVNIVYIKPKEDTPLYIRAFETPFAQVLRNLIDNAMTFSPEGGTIWLRIKSEPPSQTAIKRGVAKGRPRIVISVEDEGPGIPPDNLDTIFERFYTERPAGAQFGSHSGLGLAICRQIVRAHRGVIYAENRKDKGARFIVNLPQQGVPV